MSSILRAPWLLGAVVLAVVLRLPYLHVAPNVDEGGMTWVAAQWDAMDGSLYGSQWVDRSPVLLGLMRLGALGGDVGVRVLGAIAAVAVVVLVAMTAHALAGARAARVAAVLAALLTGSVAIMGVYTYAELLAAVPAGAAVLCLVRWRREGGDGLLAWAGALAVTAVLVKQSAIGAGAAGLVLLALARGRGLRPLAAYAAGAALPLAALAVWQALAGHPPWALPHALFGFRLEALGALDTDPLPWGARLERLAGPALGSAFVVVVPAAVAGLLRLRGDRVLQALAATWLLAGVAGVLAGGSYWAHYLIQLVPACAVLTGVAAATAPGRRWAGAVGVVAAVVVTVDAAGAVRVRERPPQALEMATAGYVREHARPGDTQYVLYARANLLRLVGLPSPYPYSWSLIIRAQEDAVPALRTVLAGDDRPTWLLQWQSFDAWDLDPGGRTAALVREHYRRVVDRICGRSVHIWLRRDDPRAVPPRVGDCPPFPPERA